MCGEWSVEWSGVWCEGVVLGGVVRGVLFSAVLASRVASGVAFSSVGCVSVCGVDGECSVWCCGSVTKRQRWRVELFRLPVSQS